MTDGALASGFGVERGEPEPDRPGGGRDLDRRRRRPGRSTSEAGAVRFGAGPAEAVIWIPMRTGPWRVRWCCRTPNDRSGITGLARTAAARCWSRARVAPTTLLRARRLLPDLTVDAAFAGGEAALHPAAPEFGNGGASNCLSGDGRYLAAGPTATRAVTSTS